MSQSNHRETSLGGIQAATGVVLLASTTQTTSTDGPTVTSRAFARSSVIGFICNVTAQSGTTPTLDVAVEASLDGGTTWFIIGIFSRYTTTTGIKIIKISSTGATAFITEEIGNTSPPAAQGPGFNNFQWDSLFRASSFIGGTLPSYTYSVTTIPILTG